MQTPVAFIIFNRPEETARVFAEIARARPAKLLVVADGPRADREGEEEGCRATRAVLDGVNWPCEVLTNFAESNMGCKRRVSSGITWVFKQVEECIILEDDCLPHPDFFRFCEELLEKYRDDERVMAISGNNFQHGQRRTPYSYYFSRYVHIWGWASWSRAWRHYDVGIEHWPLLRENAWLTDLFNVEAGALYWRDIFDRVAAGEIDTWDYQWLFACWAQSGFAVTPEVNLVTNIGFGAQSTHTTSVDESMAALKSHEMTFPLLHPPYMVRAAEADDYTTNELFLRGVGQLNLYERCRRRLASLISRRIPSRGRNLATNRIEER